MSSRYLLPLASFGQLAICQAAIFTLFIAKFSDPGLIILLQLLCHIWSCSLHVINPALIWSSSKTQNTSKFTQLPRAQRLEHTLCESPFSSAMKHRRYTNRVKCRRYALADWNLGITEEGLFREENRVALGNPVPHTCFRATSAVQPCAKRFHTLCHMPSIFSASFAHDFDGLFWFVIGVGSSNNFQAFLLPSHVQVLHSIGHVRQDPNKMFNRTRHCIQVICPAQMMEHQSVGAIHVFIKKRATSFLSESAIVSCNIFIGCDVFVRGRATSSLPESAVIYCHFETNFLIFPTSCWFSECVVQNLIPHVRTFNNALSSTASIWKWR